MTHTEETTEPTSTTGSPRPSESSATAMAPAGAAAGDALTEQAVALVARWLVAARDRETRFDRRQASQLDGVVSDPDGVRFAMRFVDRVIRPEDNRVAAEQLVSLVEDGPMPPFLSPVDRVLLRAGAGLAPVMPDVVMPLAIRRMRQIVGHLVVDADPKPMARHLERRSDEGFRLNVNQLGEAVLGDGEADRRLAKATALLDDPHVDYVSVKTSAIVSQLNYWAWDDSLARVVERLRPLFVKAASKGTFINLDMEEYHDLELTIAAFTHILDEPKLHTSDAGIVLQAYLPDSFPALQRLVAWAGARRRREIDGEPGGEIKIRLVKGANLAMEHVEAAMHGWPQAPYHTKADVDANYKRCLDWVLTPEHTQGVRIGLASHNLFDVAWGHLLATQRGVADRLELEMLQGMAVPQARAVNDDTAGELLLYTPVVSEAEFDVAISYLFRRLEENAADENFIRHLFSLEPNSAAFQTEANKFRAAVADRHRVPVGPNRTQDRAREHELGATGVGVAFDRGFDNEPDTDRSLPANQQWARNVVAAPFTPVRAPLTTDIDDVDRAVAAAAEGQRAWAERSGAERQAVLWAVGDELARRRGHLLNAMIYEGTKTIDQADPEVSEAIDFARWYADRAPELGRFEHDETEPLRFEPLGVVAVVPPWNFPVAIPAGGVLAALAAGNGVVFKPAPQTPRCAEIVAECCWAAGVPAEVLQFVRTPDNKVGRHLITHDQVAAVILTGGYETAELFRSWKPELPILAETSGKNAIVVTPHADLDLAAKDLAYSAFGHSGQKCSAASLGILVGDVYTSPRFRRQLVDAVRSLTVGPSWDLATNLGPTIIEPEGKLLRGLTRLEPGEEWLIEPRRIDDRTWTPGIRLGVEPGSWFHQTECFGPVLGLMRADTLDQAIELQNGTGYGLTGGIHSLDPHEIGHWTERIEIGNAYVNRSITGAIVRRQPFGGWKRSSIGPGAKAGGPNYVAQLGRWVRAGGESQVAAHDEAWLHVAADSDRYWWDHEFSVEHDPTGLFCESNVFRYRPLPRVAVRVEGDGHDVELRRVKAAAGVCGVRLVVSDGSKESAVEFAGRLPGLEVTRLRVLGPVDPAVRDAAHRAGVHVADDLVTANGRIELLHYLREQAVTRTLHRYGNLIG